MSRWLYFLWNQNPVVRFLSQEQSKEKGYEELDPAYETYLSSQQFYEEHQYLKLYGDEESNQQVASNDAPEPEPADGGETTQGVQTVVTAASGRQLPVIGTQYVMEQLGLSSL